MMLKNGTLITLIITSVAKIQRTLVPKLTFGPFLTLSIRNGPSVSFGTNVP